MHPLKRFPPATVWHITQHFFDKEMPRAKLHLKSNSVDSGDYDIVERLIRAFDAMVKYESEAIPPEKRPNEGIWEMSKHEFHGKAYQLLFSKDVKGLASYLSNALRESVAHGLGPGPQVYLAMTNPQDSENVTYILIDRLLSLAEALGVVCYENPEQGMYGQNVYSDINVLVSSIEQTLGWTIGRPHVMGMFGLECNGSVIDFRVPDDVYCANRLQRLREESMSGPVCEIGGGFGGMALTALRSGISKYYLVDLPLICIIQGYFLMKTLGVENVEMYGEKPSGRRVMVFPYWEFFNKTNQFDIVFNRDSLPEIPLVRVEEYLNEIEARKCILFSVNQESMALAGQKDLYQLNIHNMIKSRLAMYCSTRHPYWVRKGYLEEIYKVK